MKTILILSVLTMPLFSLSAQRTFRCGDIITDRRDGTVYHTVKIGGQCWMKENMNAGTMVKDHDQKDNGIIEKTCYANDPENCRIFGGLYTWDEAMQWNAEEGAQGICPDGWHIPARADWEQLSGELGTDSAGYSMKVPKGHVPS